MTVPLWDALVSMGVAWVFGFVAGRFLRLRTTYKPFKPNNVFPFDRNVRHIDEEAPF